MSIINISTDQMTGKASEHHAVPVDAEKPYGQWTVSWLPAGETVSYNQAITALTLAETIATRPNLDEDDPVWPFVSGWAAELGRTAREAIDLITGVRRLPL